MKRLICLCLLGILCILPNNVKGQPPNPEIVSSIQSAWVVYWDLENTWQEAEMLIAAGGIPSFFAAYYDASDMLYIPPELLEFAWELKQQHEELPMLLTVVNDRILENGRSVLKEQALVQRLLTDEESMRAHATQLVDLARTNGFAGIDMDYENLGENRALWRQYAQFLQILYCQLQRKGLQLRVTLEPRALDKANYPKGPTYAVMLYNLHGSHSSPGPKASASFIRTTLRLAKKQLGPEVQAAFASGGYVWHPDGKVQDVTEQLALARLKKAGTEAVRDADSGAMYFSHQDSKHKGQVVWYADGQTLKSWKRISAEEGITSFALWRLGGNEKASLMEYLQGSEQQNR